MAEVGLVFPSDLAGWKAWAARRNPLGLMRSHFARSMARVGRRTDSWRAALLLPCGQPEVLAVVDSWSPSCRVVLEDTIRHLDPTRVAVLTSLDEVIAAFRDGRSTRTVSSTDQLPAVEVVLSLGAFTHLGGIVKPWTLAHGIRYVVPQHGLMTPWAPPLSDGDEVLSWTDADADFWSARRDSVTRHVVGSRLLWTATAREPVELLSDRPVMLGQLHGIELHRAEKQRIYIDFCRATGATYRPHPNESDAVSLVQHEAMRRAGVVFEADSPPLGRLGRPVVSIFSTGTVEAAQRGLPAWVHHRRPPAWLRDFWERYGLSRWHSTPTRPIDPGDVDPALAAARIIAPSLVIGDGSEDGGHR